MNSENNEINYPLTKTIEIKDHSSISQNSISFRFGDDFKGLK